MIRVSQDNLFSGRRIGVGPESGIGFPNFKLLAEAFGLNYYSLTNAKKLREELDEIFSDQGASIVEVVMSPEQRYLPRLATRKLKDGSLSSPPIEDLDPPLDLRQLQEFLGERPHKNSYASRGFARDE
jgi:acetolactate synthase-1/2/3 large subunit